MILIISLNNTTQLKKHKILFVFYDVIADILSNYDLLNILLDGNIHKNFLIYNVEYKHLYDPKH